MPHSMEFERDCHREMSIPVPNTVVARCATAVIDVPRVVYAQRTGGVNADYFWWAARLGQEHCCPGFGPSNRRVLPAG
ncbi:hypothetical protein AGR6A_Lc80002 [Agrobacterium sp. NCPPB 925]|nr:hypothetical protein AGR6A_Lc80002 [Agrobacterium sp. NCPPB 925]